MTEKELAKQIIDRLPEYKMTSLLLFLRGIEFSDEIEDDLYCEKLVEDYLNNIGEAKGQGIPIEELAKREGIEL